ncbi:hypothetical protein PIB30_030967 [Stylosanthes scabra]|uniref:Uncharacterized protein n=1 Tax=Stylosanthes scabra TaxID=79078 RepID=A0ABU6TBY9_9FABA|nr:hypothetical protein [Stylosanthes scabra]
MVEEQGDGGYVDKTRVWRVIRRRTRLATVASKEERVLMSSMVMAAIEMCRGGVEECEVEDELGEGGVADEFKKNEVGRSL